MSVAVVMACVFFNLSNVYHYFLALVLFQFLFCFFFISFYFFIILFFCLSSISLQFHNDFSILYCNKLVFFAIFRFSFL